MRNILLPYILLSSDSINICLGALQSDKKAHFGSTYKYTIVNKYEFTYMVYKL